MEIIEQADLYIEQHYTSKDPMRCAWGLISSADKEVLLRIAYEEIRALPIKLDFSSENIIFAQIELALYLSNENLQTERNKRLQLQQMGVKSMSLGDLSESYSEKSVCERSVVYSSKKAMRYLSPYLSGGYAIC